MHFKFDSRAKYLSPKQEKDWEKFREIEPAPGTVYEADGGEKRICRMVKYPVGVVTEMTAWGDQQRDGSRAYHTPMATQENGEALVYYDDTEGNHFSCSGNEWLEFVAKGFKTEDAPDPEIPVALQKARQAQRARVEQEQKVEDAEKLVERKRGKKADKEDDK